MNSVFIEPLLIRLQSKLRTVSVGKSTEYERFFQHGKHDIAQNLQVAFGVYDSLGIVNRVSFICNEASPNNNTSSTMFSCSQLIPHAFRAPYVVRSIRSKQLDVLSILKSTTFSNSSIVQIKRSFSFQALAFLLLPQMKAFWTEHLPRLLSFAWLLQRLFRFHIRKDFEQCRASTQGAFEIELNIFEKWGSSRL